MSFNVNGEKGLHLHLNICSCCFQWISRVCEVDHVSPCQMSVAVIMDINYPIKSDVFFTFSYFQ